ncbi:MAG: transporter substrate-binding domain-containing protein [Proteobacteria bacterium]|nr:transporter substrate-binding domain-containing protein [Pseudomonadota bacterium]MBU1685879.1 transporter substrate-binding domain-containing protein [Pseudomonadota bacterium]
MKNHQWFKSTTALSIMLLAATFFGLSDRPALADQSQPIPPVLKSASELDYPPFAIVKADGTADGFSVDLLKAVVKAANLEVNIKVGPWHEIKQQLTDGLLDVLPLVAYTPERDKIYDFTVPYLDMHGTIFIRKGKTTIQSEADLKGKEVLVMRNDSSHEYAVAHDLTNQLILTDTFEEAMQLLSEGRHDAVLCQQLMGLQIIKKLGITNVVSVAAEDEISIKPRGIAVSGLEQKFCLAVPEGRKELLALLNEGLAIVFANGTYDTLYSKWFSPILPAPSVPLTTLIKSLLTVLGPILLIFAVLGIWYLKREVSQKTQSLREEITERQKSELALRESEHKFRLLFENMLNGFAYHKIITDNTGTPIDYEFIEVNEAFEKLTGLKRENILGKCITTIHPGIEKMEFDWIGIYGRVALTGEPVNFEQYFDPQKHWYAVSAYCPQRGYFAVTFENITEQKQATKELQDFIKFHEQIIQCAQDGIIVYDRELRYQVWNPFMERVSGKKAADVLGKHPLEVFPFLEEVGVISKLEKALQGEIPPAVDFRYSLPESGKSGWTSDTTSPLFDAEGKIIGVIGIVREITQQKQAELALQEKTAFLDAIIESSALSMWISDEKGTAIRANPACFKLFGAAEEEVISKYNLFQDTVIKKQGFMPIVKEVFEKGVVADIKLEYDFGAVDHVEVSHPSHKFINSIFTPILDDNDKVRNVIVQTIDLTDLKNIELEKAKLENQVRQAQKMEAIGTLAGGIAHDFNNILSIILGYTDMAIDDAPPGSKQVDDLIQVQEAGNRAKELVKQILAFSRQDEIKRIPIQLQSLIKEALKILRSSIPTTIEIQHEIDSECGVVLVDPTQVHQILMNLCTNANHAMEKSGGILKIELKSIYIEQDTHGKALNIKPGKYVNLIVSDTGTGIGPDVINKIFDPYFTTKEFGKGTGMGLAIAHGIITSYGGWITVESALGKGTTFQVYFPVINQQSLPLIKSIENLPRGKERILFIDDEDLLAEMGKAMLERLGYTVTVRQSSLHALTTFQNSPEAFDLIITDQTMPGMTGSDLARRLMQIRPDIPIILCTGYSTLIDEDSAKAMGIREFALKPLTKETLATLIRKVLRNNHPG